MKKILTSILALIPLVYGCEKDSSNTSINTKLEEVEDVCLKMTDKYFQQYCYNNFDTNGDGQVSMAEAAKVYVIECSTAEDFTGIEYFTNLEKFKSTSVKQLDLRQNTKLVSIYLTGSPIEYLDLSNCLEMTNLDELALSGCSNLASVKLPESINSLDDYALCNCASLKSIDFPENITSIGNDAFNGCQSLESIILPKNLTSMGEYAFALCSYLSYISFPGSLSTIEKGAFSGCSNLSTISFSEGLTTIGNTAFANCSGLQTISFPESLTTIGESAFVGCTSLPTISFSEGLTTIGNSAFMGTNLTSILLPASLTSIGFAAFLISSLTAVDIKADTPPTLGEIPFFSKYTTNATLRVPAESIDAYESSDWAQYFSSIEAL